MFLSKPLPRKPARVLIPRQAVIGRYSVMAESRYVEGHPDSLETP